MLDPGVGQVVGQHTGLQPLGGRAEDGVPPSPCPYIGSMGTEVDKARVSLFGLAMVLGRAREAIEACAEGSRLAREGDDFDLDRLLSEVRSALEAYVERMEDMLSSRRGPAESQRRSRQVQDPSEESSLESFPASDAPGHY